ncbi:MAG: carbohydrate-binding domain-containing protein [Synergistaceae bacterium]|nr:carbohydrate-binding domain-containing protein [Synergistaceae bacterium]
MKKFSKWFYLFLMALLVFSLSGCGNDDDDNNTTSSKNTGSTLMVVNSEVFKQNGTYKLYKGGAVETLNGRVKDYVAPSVTTTGTQAAMNLEFNNFTSTDSFLFTEVDSDGNEKVVLAHNPKGTADPDFTTQQDSAIRVGGKLQKYTSLELSEGVNTSAVDFDDSDAIEIVLDSSTETAKVTSGDSTTLTPNNYVWHLSPDVGEYWTLSGATYDDEEDVQSAIEGSSNYAYGIYIARDIRYVPDTLTFTSTTSPKATDDNEGMYVAYYNVGASGKVTVQSADTYILAALPAEEGMPGGQGGQQQGGFNGQQQGGNPPSIPGAQASSLETVKSAMTHSASDAYNNPVLHITKPGTYKISGTWNGQIWVDIPDESVTEGTDTEDDPYAQVNLILNGVRVNCSVAPALVFNNVYEAGETSSTKVAAASMDIAPYLADTDENDAINGGANIFLAGDTTNVFVGTNVARINKLKLNDDDGYSETTDSLKYVKSLKKMYKLDGAFHSRVSLLIANFEDTDGTLIVSSDYEGLDSEMHMYIESGIVQVQASDDGINVNEDNTSVFHMEGGSLTVVSTGGDGIDSNGYIIFTGADKLSVTASSNNTKPSSKSQLNAQAEGPLDADLGIYMTDEVFEIYTVGDGSISLNPNNNTTDGGDDQSDNTVTKTVLMTDANGNEIVYLTNASPLEDTDTSDRGIPTSGNVFKLTHAVNDFSGITNNN